MNWQGLEIYNPNAPDEVKTRALRENFLRIGQQMSKAGVVLKAWKVATSESVLPSVATGYKPLECAFESGGGLVSISCKVFSQQDSGGNVQASLWLDGNRQDFGTMGNSGGAGTIGEINLSYSAVIPAGNHFCEIRVLGAAATCRINYNSLGQSTIQIVEYIF